jgi:hypothetical protein
MSLFFVLRRRENEGGPRWLPFPIAKPHDWLERVSRIRQKRVCRYRTDAGMSMLFVLCSRRTGSTPAGVLASILK